MGTNSWLCPDGQKKLDFPYPIQTLKFALLAFKKRLKRKRQFKNTLKIRELINASNTYMQKSEQ